VWALVGWWGDPAQELLLSKPVSSTIFVTVRFKDVVPLAAE